MPAGLQTFDQNGVLMIDTSRYVFKTTTFDIGQVTTPGSINVAALGASGVQVGVVVDKQGLAPSRRSRSATTS
jgi:hypothetical protein